MTKYKVIEVDDDHEDDSCEYIARMCYNCTHQSHGMSGAACREKGHGLDESDCNDFEISTSLHQAFWVKVEGEFQE